SKHHIQHPVQAILDSPVAAHRCGNPLGLRGQTTDVVTHAGVRFSLRVHILPHHHHQALQVLPARAIDGSTTLTQTRSSRPSSANALPSPSGRLPTAPFLR